MAYQFQTQNTASMKTVLSNTKTEAVSKTINGINPTETDANIIMGGLSILFDIGGLNIGESTRTVKQDVISN